MAGESYRGRFAPSPTGPLHFGSLVAAAGSYLEARTHGGAWLVRMEDLDPPREMPGAADDILSTLELYGFEWDGAVEYQSRRSTLYEATLERLKRQGQLYPCACTRKEIAESAVIGIDGPIYPGTCSHGLAPGKEARTWRVRTNEEDIAFEDAIQGGVSQNLSKEVGDFVLKRADGFCAYQLAVVVDDADQGITHVVRGSDLLDSTPSQIHLQRLLGYAQPHYSHLPVATNHAGEKLSKQTRATALPKDAPVRMLWQALAFLGQQPDSALQVASLPELWLWAREHWNVASVPRCRGIEWIE